MIIQNIIEHYSKQSVIDRIRNAEIKESERTASDLKERNDLMIKLNQVQTEIDNLMQSLSQGNEVLIKYINEKIVDLDKKKSSIASRLSEIDSGNTKNQEEVSLLKQLNLVLDDIPTTLQNGTFDEIKNLCHILVKRIVFQKDGQIDIEYTI